jgi:hypothetical protein
MGTIRTAESIGALTQTSVTTLSLAASRVNVGASQYVTSALTLNLAVTGVGGLDATVAANVVYTIYAVYSSGQVYLIGSRNSTAPNGFAQARVVGSFTTNASSQINVITSTPGNLNVAGSVLIDTTTGDTPFRVLNSRTNAGHAKMSLESTGPYAATYVCQNSVQSYVMGIDHDAGANSWTVYDVTDGAYRLFIDTDGKVGIGTPVPGASLHNAGQSLIPTNGSTTIRQMKVGRATITADGANGIVNIAPGVSFADTSKVAIFCNYVGDSYTGVTFECTVPDIGTAKMRVKGSNSGTIMYQITEYI